MSREPGPFRDSVTFAIYAPPYSSAGRIAAAIEGPDRFLRVLGSARNVASKLFEPSVIAAVAREDLILASTSTPALRRIGVDAQTKGTWQLNTRRRPVSAAQVRAERERRMQELEASSSRPVSLPPGFSGPPPETQRLRREAVESLEAYSTFPEFRSIVAGSDGAVWLEDYPLPGATRVKWYRLENGVANAWIELESTARILAVTNGLIVQVVRDALDIETAVVLRIQ